MKANGIAYRLCAMSEDKEVPSIEIGQTRSRSRRWPIFGSRLKLDRGQTLSLPLMAWSSRYEGFTHMTG